MSRCNPKSKNTAICLQPQTFNLMSTILDILWANRAATPLLADEVFVTVNQNPNLDEPITLPEVQAALKKGSKQGLYDLRYITGESQFRYSFAREALLRNSNNKRFLDPWLQNVLINPGVCQKYSQPMCVKGEASICKSCTGNACVGVCNISTGCS